MYNSEFEKQVQEKMEALRMTPSGDLWSRIEHDLPRRPRKRRYLLLLAALLLLAGIVWTAQHFNSKPAGQQKAGSAGKDNTTAKFAPGATPSPASTVDPAETQQGSTAPGLPQAMPGDKTVAAAPDAANTASPGMQQAAPGSNAASATVPDKNHTTARTRPQAVPGRRTGSQRQPGSADQPQLNTAAVKRSSKSRMTITTAAPQQDTEAGESAVTAALSSQPQQPAALLLPAAPAMNTVLWPGQKIRTQTAALSAAAKTAERPARKRWQPGFTAGAGLSRQVNSPIEIGISSIAYLQGGGVQPSAADSLILGSSETRVRPSLAFDAGLHLRRQFSKKWAVQAGIGYSYQSYLRRVGRFVDSSGNFSNNNTQVGYSSYYRAPTAASNHNYTNRLHWLQLPVEVQYSPGRNGRWQLLGGMTAGYLAGGNALVSRYAAEGYVISIDAYNRLRLSLHTGAAYRTGGRLPLTAGIRFSFDATPFIKRELGGQYIMASSFFISMPLKK